jgi:hypothetical protein
MIRELLIAFGILGVCLVIHITGMMILAQQLVGRRIRIEERIATLETPLMLVVVFSFVITLHVTEAALWAGFYRYAELFPDFETSLYFSLKSYSTVGYGDVLLPHRWRLLGTVEGISGVLLCGLSASFFFALVNALFRFQLKRTKKPKQRPAGRKQAGQTSL